MIQLLTAIIIIKENIALGLDSFPVRIAADEGSMEKVLEAVSALG